jgi:hypothetical protein
VIIVIRNVTFETLVGTFMGGLAVAEAGLAVMVVVAVAIVVDWGVPSKHMPATKYMMMEPVHLSLLWRI